MNFRLLGALAAAVTLLASANPSEAQGRRGGGGRDGGSTRLLFTPEVQRELKMEQAQIDLLMGLRSAQGNGGANRESLRNLSREEREKRAAQMRAEQDKKVAEILDRNQVTRFKQLQLQQAGTRALTEQPVADALKLTPAQRDQIRATVEAERTAMREAFQGFRGNNGQRPTQEQREAATAKLRESRTATDAKILSILTPEQKKQFEGMKGAPFTFPQRGQRRQQQ